MIICNLNASLIESTKKGGVWKIAWLLNRSTMMNETLNLRSNSFISFTMQHNIYNPKTVSVHTMVTKINESLFTEHSIQC